MDSKKKAQSAKDYEVHDSKSIIPSSYPITPQKQIIHPISNRFSPLQMKPEIPFKSVLVSNPPKPSNIQIPNSPDTLHKYVTKDYSEDLGMTPHVDYPTELYQKDYIKSRFHNPQQLWESDNPIKDQRFYELILVDSDSAEITHIRDNEGKISYSKCIIKKIFTVTTFGGIQEFKNFSIKHPARGFNYFDYKNAWSRSFFIRPFNHSWFISFHSQIDKHFPIWFFDWWKKFGSSIQITPPTIQKGFNVFVEISHSHSYQKSILFHAEFKVPWIFAWDFSFKKVYADPTPYSLVRIFKIKWWNKFQEHICSENSIRHYFATGQKVTYQKDENRKNNSKASSSKGTDNQNLSGIPEEMKKEFFEFLAQRSSSTRTRSEESVSSDPIGGQDPYDF